MKCRFLRGRYMMTCRAGVDAYVPSAFEMQEYCLSNSCKVCPLYSRARNLEERGLFSSGSGRGQVVLSP